MKTAQRPSGLILTSEHGYDRIRQARRRGAIRQVRRAAYLPDAENDEDEWERAERQFLARCHAVAATLTCRFAFARESAGFLHGWPAPATGPVHIVQTSRVPTGGSRDIVRHHTRDLTDENIVMIEGLPVTTTARTAIDCALGCEPPLGLAMVDAALGDLAAVDRRERDESIARQDEWRDQLADMLDARGSVRHARRAREVIRYSDGLAESGQESWLRWLALSRGMPVPELQVPIDTPRGLRYPDAMWSFDTVPGAKPLLAEYDGARKYRRDPGRRVNPELVVLQEKDRQAMLEDATGGTMLRFTKLDRRDHDAAFARLLRATPLTPGDLTPRRDLSLSSALTLERRLARRDRG